MCFKTKWIVFIIKLCTYTFSEEKFMNLSTFRRNLIIFNCLLAGRNSPKYFPYAERPKRDSSRKNPVIAIHMDLSLK